MADVPLLIADLALLLCAVGSALWAWRLRRRLDNERALLGAWALSALFIALAVPARLLPGDGGSDLGALRQMSLNLAVYVSLPLMATAVYALGRGRLWSAAGWGRLLLGLFAGFELGRQLGYGNAYLYTLVATASLAALAGGLMLKTPTAQRTATVSALLLGVGFALISPAAPDWSPGLNWRSPAGFGALSALSLLLISAALHRELAATRPGTQ